MRTLSRRALVSAALALSLSAAEGSAQSVQLPLDTYQVQGGFRNGDEQLPYSVYCGARPSCHHLGEDVSASVGTPVKAVADGVVIYSRKNRRGYGQYVVIAHTAPVPFVSIYAHLSRQTLYPMRGLGSVRRGDVVGYIGSKAENGGFDPHLHFGVYNSAHLADGLFHYWGSAPNPDGDDVDIDPLGRPVGGRHTAPGAFIQALISQSTSVARPDAFTMHQGSSFASPAPGVPGVPGILDNDDVQGQLQSVEFIGAPAGLNVTEPRRGFFVFTPAPTFVGSVTFSYRIVTSTGTSAPATVAIQVSPLPTPPVARDDSGPAYSVTQGGLLNMPAPGVLSNDTYELGATVEFIAPLPAGFTGSTDGSFSLDLSATPSVVGTLGWQYRIRSVVNGDSNVATVAIQVTPTTVPDFFDHFNRPNGAVGNGWIDMSSNAQGNLVIGNGALSTPGPNGTGGVYRSVDTSRSITLSARFTYLNGFGGALYRYDTALLFGSDGVGESGYGVLFTRGDQNYADSAVHLVYNGTVLQTLQSTFQFADSVSTTFTWSPDGSVVGSASDQVNVFNFAFGARFVTLPGQNLAVRLGFPDGRSGVIVNPTVDDLGLTYGASTSSAAFTNPTGGWIVRSDGRVTSMPIPPTPAGLYVGIQGLFRTLPANIDDWNSTNSCYGASGSYSTALGSDLRIAYGRPIDLFVDMGLGSANCTSAGTYYAVLADPATRQHLHVYSIHWNGVLRSPTYTYTNGLGFGTDVLGNQWNVWSANGSNIWNWQQDYVGGYLHYRFLINNYVGFYCSGSCRYQNVWSKDPTTGFELSDVVSHDVGLIPENYQNGHTYSVDVQWSATGYRVSTVDLTDGSVIPDSDVTRPVTATTYSSWTWGTSEWGPSGSSFSYRESIDHARLWQSSVYGEAATGVSGGGGDIRTDAVPVMEPVPQ